MIGYYVHHHGSGHRTRAQAIIRHLDVPVVTLSSEPCDRTGFADVVQLDRDDTATTPTAVTAGGVLHWVPRHDGGLRGRMAQIAEFVATRKPDAIVVDVSVEVAVFVRLMGVPVIVMAMPGERTDPAHRLAYSVADAIIAPWPEELYQPTWLDEYRAKTTFTGGISRHDGREPAASRLHAADILVMTGTGGTRTACAEVMQVAADHPDLTVRGLGTAFGTWVDDPWPDLCSAGLVVVNGGQGSVADVAAAQRPALVLPQERPFDEQLTTARTLVRAGLARVSETWPSRDDWREVIADARSAVPHWVRWETAGAARRAARAIESVARAS